MTSKYCEHLWPCPGCGAKDFKEAGNLCNAGWTCSADDEREMEESQRIKVEHSQTNSTVKGK